MTQVIQFCSRRDLGHKKGSNFVVSGQSDCEPHVSDADCLLVTLGLSAACAGAPALPEYKLEGRLSKDAH